MHKNLFSRGFTIVELLVVVVVIGILAAVSFVIYSGVSDRANAASLQYDLENSQKLLKMYLVEYGAFPSLDANNCPASPSTTNANYCLNLSSGNTVDSYSYTSSSFTLVLKRASLKYQISESSLPTQVGGGAVLPSIYAATSNGLSISTDGGTTFTNKTTTNGLGTNIVNSVSASGSNVYAGTSGGLSISTDGGASFTNKTTANGLGSNTVNGVYASSSNVYAATNAGLSISTDGGASFTNKTTANGLGGNTVYGVYAFGSNVYAAANVGIAISTNGGSTFTYKYLNGGYPTVNNVSVAGSSIYGSTLFGVYVSTDGGVNYNLTSITNSTNSVFASGTNVYAGLNGNGLAISTNGGSSSTIKTTTNGLGSGTIKGVYASGSNVYAATNAGLSISTDGGASFTNKTTANGLGSNTVNAVFTQ